VSEGFGKRFNGQQNGRRGTAPKLTCGTVTAATLVQQLQYIAGPLVTCKRAYIGLQAVILKVYVCFKAGVQK
jgi:hypothetical protein